MKKTSFLKINNLSLFLFLGCLFSFNLSCGLDTFEVFDSPEITSRVPDDAHESYSYEGSYFEFDTNETRAASYSTITFLGTDIYYKIYKSASKLTSDVNKLNEIALSTENSADAFLRMKDVYKYVKLSALSGKNTEVLIPSKKVNQKVYIRLTDFQDSINKNYAAKILVDNTNLNNSLDLVKPLRSIENYNLSFNFGRYHKELSNYRDIYVSDDEDIDTTTDSNSSDNIWYVAMFAVAVARDITFSPQYSNILYLGNVKIDSSLEDN